MDPRFNSAIATFGAGAKAKLANPAVKGEPEDQLRAPLERLIVDLAEFCGVPRNEVVAVGESSLSEMKTRPDYAVTVRKTLVGFIEVKAPGKGADPRKFKGRHDKGQWEKLRSLPNLVYTDGNEFSLWPPAVEARDVQPGRWLAEYTTELINVLNVLGRLVNLERAQAELLEQVCSGETISDGELRGAGTYMKSTTLTPGAEHRTSPNQPSLLD